MATRKARKISPPILPCFLGSPTTSSMQGCRARNCLHRSRRLWRGHRQRIRRVSCRWRKPRQCWHHRHATDTRWPARNFARAIGRTRSSTSQAQFRLGSVFDRVRPRRCRSGTTPSAATARAENCDDVATTEWPDSTKTPRPEYSPRHRLPADTMAAGNGAGSRSSADPRTDTGDMCRPRHRPRAVFPAISDRCPQYWSSGSER